MLGSESDGFQTGIPDIRMPANQYWPLHWHDCWIAVVVLDGRCLIGDWWMGPGDVLISAAELEYGPVVNGPSGCQLFEIFAKQHLSPGGYAPEFHDHPTVQGRDFAFLPRSSLNQRNAGNQVLPNGGVEGLTQGHLTPGASFNLGPDDDPERTVMLYTGLSAGERLPRHSYGDWRGIFVFDGAMQMGDRQLGKDDVLIIEPGVEVPAFEAGEHGVELLEVSRTASGVERIPG
jgi:hypothetical protein